MLYLNPDDELKELLKEIQQQNKSIAEWKELESSDEFQSAKYCGGFDGTEEKFTFSYFKGKEEYWFELSTDEVDEVLCGSRVKVELRRADG
ncbi:MAG: hypothetical protein AAGI23_01130 [Bacteroidota bacterium]